MKLLACRASWQALRGVLRRVAVAALVALAVLPAPVTAQMEPALHVTTKLKIYINSDIADRDFIPFLAQRLEERLRVPIELYNTDIDYTQADRSWRGAYHAESVENLFLQNGVSPEPYATEIIMIGEDMYMPPDRWNFSTMFWWEEKNKYRTMMVSLHRLVPDQPYYSPTVRAIITADRLYKVIMKNTAFLSGRETQGCLLQFPRSVPQLDLLPTVFCPEDEKRLAEAGLLRN